MKITNTEELRAELDKFSPEQEREKKEAEVNKEIAVLTETLSDIKDTIGKLSPLADALKEASTVHIPKDVEYHLTSSLTKYVFYNWLINNILYLCVT